MGDSAPPPSAHASDGDERAAGDDDDRVNGKRTESSVDDIVHATDSSRAIARWRGPALSASPPSASLGSRDDDLNPSLRCSSMQARTR